MISETDNSIAQILLPHPTGWVAVDGENIDNAIMIANEKHTDVTEGSFMYAGGIAVAYRHETGSWYRMGTGPEIPEGTRIFADYNTALKYLSGIDGAGWEIRECKGGFALKSPHKWEFLT